MTFPSGFNQLSKEVPSRPSIFGNKLMSGASNTHSTTHSSVAANSANRQVTYPQNLDEFGNMRYQPPAPQVATAASSDGHRFHIPASSDGHRFHHPVSSNVFGGPRNVGFGSSSSGKISYHVSYYESDSENVSSASHSTTSQVASGSSNFSKTGGFGGMQGVGFGSVSHHTPNRIKETSPTASPANQLTAPPTTTTSSLGGTTTNFQQTTPTCQQNSSSQSANVRNAAPVAHSQPAQCICKENSDNINANINQITTLLQQMEAINHTTQGFFDIFAEACEKFLRLRDEHKNRFNE